MRADRVIHLECYRDYTNRGDVSSRIREKGKFVVHVCVRGLDIMCSRRQHLSRCVILSGLLSLWMDLTSGVINIQLMPQYPVIGESVSLSVTGVTGRILSITWYKGLNTTPEYVILTYLPADPSPLLPGNLYIPRARPFPNGSLLITDLHITDSSNYTVRIQTLTTQEQAYVTLTVYERVSKPTVTASISQPKENDRLTLTCDTRNAERILWSRNSVSLPSGPILSADNRTVTFSSVKRGDSGEYRCEAENPVSRSTSDPYSVTVYYGPENVLITGTLYVTFGSDILLSCSAVSVPPPSYQWRFKNEDLNINQNPLVIHNASSDKQGDYTCVATNPETRLTADSSVFVNVTAVGPENVTITGLLHIHVGSDISLNCSADSLPPPNYHWRFNDLELNNSKTLLIHNATLKSQGNYTCVVTNPETLRTANASVYLNVTMEAANIGGMGKGLIIGIVVACLLLVALVAAMLYLFMIHKQRKKPSDKISMMNIPSGNGQSGPQAMEQPELQYAAIAFNPNMPRKQQNEAETQYADIKIQKKTGGKQQEPPELLYADIDLSKNVPRKKQQPPESAYGNTGAQGAPAPENTVYSELKLH